MTSINMSIWLNENDISLNTSFRAFYGHIEYFENCYINFAFSIYHKSTILSVTYQIENNQDLEFSTSSY